MVGQDGGNDACWVTVYCGILKAATALELLGVVIMGWVQSVCACVCVPVFVRWRRDRETGLHRETVPV